MRLALLFRDFLSIDTWRRRFYILVAEGLEGKWVPVGRFHQCIHL